MIAPLGAGILVRERGNWVNSGDSISSGFGGVVPWITQASFWPDVVTIENFSIASQSVGPDTLTTPIPAMITTTELAQFDAAFNVAKDYNIGSLQGGLNDLSLGRSVADVYTDMTTWKTGRAAAGFKTIAICPIRIDAASPIFATRAVLRTTMLANLAGFDAVVDLDGIPGTPGDGINYEATNGHLTTLGQGQLWLLVTPFWRALVGL